MAQLNPQTSGGLSTYLMTYLEKVFLTRLESKLLLAQFGKKFKLRKGQGSSMNWRRWSNLAAATTALSEGVSPNGTALTLNSVTVTLAQYGDFVTVTDFLSMTAVNDVMKEAVDLLSYGGALTIDQIIRNALDANFTIQFADAANNATEAAVATGLDQFGSVEVRAAVEALRNADAPEYDDGMYVGVIHPFAEGNLIAESAAGTGMEALKHTDATPTIKGLIGSIYGVKLYRSSNIRAVTADVYRNLIFGKDAYGVVDIEGGALDMIIHPTGSAGSEDPLNQRATVGYKVTFASAVLQAARGIRVSAYGI